MNDTTPQGSNHFLCFNECLLNRLNFSNHDSGVINYYIFNIISQKWPVELYLQDKV